MIDRRTRAGEYSSERIEQKTSSYFGFAPILELFILLWLLFLLIPMQSLRSADVTFKIQLAALAEVILYVTVYVFLVCRERAPETYLWADCALLLVLILLSIYINITQGTNWMEQFFFIASALGLRTVINDGCELSDAQLNSLGGSGLQGLDERVSGVNGPSSSASSKMGISFCARPFQ